MADDPVYELNSGKHHPFYVPQPSIWPLAGSFAAGLLAILAVIYMHNGAWKGIQPGLVGVGIGFVAVLGVMWAWWRQIIKEAVVDGHTPIYRIGFRYSMALFIASEVMFFFAFFWAFFAASLFPSAAIGGVWPPANIQPIDPFDLPFLMTMILLLSGCTVTWAHHAILENKREEASKALLITVLLGIVFTGFQAFEYYHAPFKFKEGIYSSAFYMATGFHGFHVLVGTIFLAVCYFRNRKGHFTADSHFGFEAAAWYWHFVDVVWLFLFASIYWWGNA
jgi:cytochrome c oxidase subunit 3